MGLTPGTRSNTAWLPAPILLGLQERNFSPIPEGDSGAESTADGEIDCPDPTLPWPAAAADSSSCSTDIASAPDPHRGSSRNSHPPCHPARDPPSRTSPDKTD